jgi:hypothetical protein
MQNRIVEILRIEETGPGTFGVLRVNKEAFCWTLELSDLLNAPSLIFSTLPTNPPSPRNNTSVPVTKVTVSITLS